MEISTNENNIKSQQRSTMVLLGILSIVFMCFFLEPVSSLRFPHLDAFDAVSTEDVHVEISEHFLSSNRERRSSLPFPEKIKLQLRSKRFSPIITLQKNFNARTWIPIRYHNNDTYLNEPNYGSEPYQAYMDKIYDASALVTRTNGRLEVMMEFYIDGRQFFVVTKLDPSNTEDIIHTLVEPRNLFSRENDYKREDEGEDPPIDHERLKRETTPVSTVNKIELLIFVDFSLFKFWKELTPKNGTNKEQVALRMIEQYYAFMGSAVNQRYQNINDSTLNIQVEVVGIIIAENEAGSPWTEKNSNRIDANQTLVEFGNYIKANRKSLIGHDHAVLLTRYDIIVSGNPNAAGFAFLSTLCRDNSVSVVEDQFNFVSLTVITHEIGHSLSATHDGTGVNTCNGSLGYIMATVNSPTTGSMAYNQWLFSDCSKIEFQNYIQKLDETSSNCMKWVDDLNHNNYTIILPGTQYTADKQCIIMRDEKDSYMCRTSYNFEGVFDYSSICTGMLCKVSSSSTCSMALPADGTPCGSKKWCINGRCVQSDSVPSTCIHGDQINEVYNGMGCSAFVLPSRYNCKDPIVREVCCMSCQICLPGSYQPSVSSALCMPCPVGSYQTLSNSTACIPCSPGTYQNQTGSSSPCILCQAGTFQNLTGQVNCVSCPVGYYQPSQGSPTCLLCNAGSYQPQTGASSCTPCQVGSYQNFKGQGSCTICPTGRTTDTTGSTSVDNCYPVCLAGSYRPFGVSYCMTCTAGMYQPATGQKSCLPCQPGTYQNLTGQTSCKFCAVGTNQTSSGSTSCTPCKQGYYQPNEMSPVCIACSAGWYQPSIGASSCNQCEIGSYQRLQGQGSCIKCPTGKTTDATGSTSGDNCYSVVRFIGILKINRNYKPTYENKSSTDFKNLEQELTKELDKACRNGTLRSFCKYSKLTSTRNGSIVAETELGYLANPLVTEISVTSSMMEALSQSSSSIAQAINTSFTTFSQLSACSAGSYRSPAVSECVACATGMFQPESGQISCVPCQPGTYQNLTGQTSCKSCIVGTYQANEKSQVCIACSAGWYQPSPGASSCNQCEIGSYQSLQGQNSCIKCPANKTTDATGSTSVDNCYSVARFVGTLKINRDYKATYGDKSSTDFKNLEQELTTEMDKVCRNGSLKNFCKYSKLINTRNGSIVAETELGYQANPLVTEISVTSSMMKALSQSSSSIAQAINTSFTAFSQLSDSTTTTTSTTKAPISTPSFIMGNEKRLPEWVIPVAASIGGALILGVVIAMCCSSCRKEKETKEDIDYHHTEFNKTYASALFEQRYIKGKPDTEQHKGKKHLDTRGGLSRGDERSKRTSSDDKYSSDFITQDPYSAPHKERNNRRHSHYNHQSKQLVTNSEAPFYISGKNDIMNKIMIDSENEYRLHSPRHHKKHHVHGHRQMDEYDW
ncbi:hypothetical protein CHS0354_007935 [Potamilus streckersoni]|uniref:Uncharacterized protein n=1 Tax=Potamilus streckersoni TaxID=2493646 RepID=A0AAE0VRF2_9BIVA|nr:hypothetical protein CHS0354_007935 [Potamilus streckersoni]